MLKTGTEIMLNGKQILVFQPDFPAMAARTDYQYDHIKIHQPCQNDHDEKRQHGKKKSPNS